MRLLIVSHHVFKSLRFRLAIHKAYIVALLLSANFIGYLYITFLLYFKKVSAICYSIGYFTVKLQFICSVENTYKTRDLGTPNVWQTKLNTIVGSG